MRLPAHAGPAVQVLQSWHQNRPEHHALRCWWGYRLQSAWSGIGLTPVTRAAGLHEGITATVAAGRAAVCLGGFEFGREALHLGPQVNCLGSESTQFAHARRLPLGACFCHRASVHDMSVTRQ